MKNNVNILKIGMWLVALAFAAGGFYLLVNFRLDAVENNVVEVEDDVENIDARVDMVEDIVSIIQNDLNYIRGDLVEQKELSKEILKELRKP